MLISECDERCVAKRDVHIAFNEIALLFSSEWSIASLLTLSVYRSYLPPVARYMTDCIRTKQNTRDPTVWLTCQFVSSFGFGSVHFDVGDRRWTGQCGLWVMVASGRGNRMTQNVKLQSGLKINIDWSTSWYSPLCYPSHLMWRTSAALYHH